MIRPAVLLLAVLSAGGISAFRSHQRKEALLERAATQARVRDLDIAFYAQRAERDPTAAADLGHLAALYLQRARDTGSNDDLLRAERVARLSLSHRAAHNGRARAILASALVAQHRFVEAREIAVELLVLDPERTSYLSLLAEIDLELGRYDEAKQLFGRLWLYRSDLAIAPRLARWEELQGHTEQARQLLLQASRDAARRADLPPGQQAWFHLRVGDLALRNGHLSAAERAIEAGLASLPEDHRLLAARARLEAARHRWRLAISYGERAIASALDPATLGLVADAYAALGDSAKASEYQRVMELTVRSQLGPFHRAWSLFLLDHERDIETVLTKARGELESRRDIYGYDLLAWALHKSGRDAEAREAMSHALALGTRDAMLFYHMGMIERALGNDAAARRHLQAALDTNPYWHPFQPATARAVLDSIGEI
jgi:tetratricopeptide (TPR) repeat protein